MRFVFTLIFILFLDLYSFQALRTVAQGWSSGQRQWFFGLFWGIWALTTSFLALSASGVELPKLIITFGRATVFITYLAKLAIVPFLAIDDLWRIGSWLSSKVGGTAAPLPSRQRFLSAMGLGLGSIPLFSLTYGMIANPYRYRLYREKVTLKNLPPALRGLKIVQISDIHSGSFTFKDPVKNAIDLINAQEPDLVFFTGDLVNNRADEMDPFMDVFNGIRAKYGVYSVLGNHDYGDYEPWPSAEAKVANLEKLKNIHRQLGWDLLLNEHRLVEINGAPVAILGVENYSAHLRFPRHGKLDQAHAGTEKAAVRLLLSHDPSHWDFQIIPQFRDIDLTFSGHTHGCQFGIEIPGWIKWSPIQYLYKQWGGLYQQGEQYLYVNRGLGFLGYPGRVGILPEITLLELE